MRTCADIRERLTLYLDNELQDDERVAIEAHVQSCASCKAFVEKELAFLNAIRGSGPLHAAPAELKSKVGGVVSSSKQAVHRSSPLRWIVPIAAVLLLLITPVVVWRVMRQANRAGNGGPSPFALRAVESHLRHMRGQLPLEVESTNPQEISTWFANKVNFNVKLPSYQESSGQEKVYTLEGARLVGFENDYAAYVAYRMKIGRAHV